MKRFLSLLTLFCLTLLVHAEIQQPTVVVYWQFQAYPGSIQSVSRVTIQPMPPYPKLNGAYEIPNPVAFFPSTYPLITNGIVSTNVAVDTPFKVTFSGPFGSRSVTNFFPSVLTNGAGPYNASIYDVQAIAQFNDYIIGVWFNGTNFLGAGLAPTNLTGAQGITIGGVYPNYIIGAQGQIITNAATFAIALSNNFRASNITANANLSVGTNITASGVTVVSGMTNQSLTTNQPMFASTGGQEISVPISTFTNGVSAALTALNSATSNAMIATNAALLVTIAAGSNSIANSLAATNTALLVTIAATSNSAASTLAATNTALLATIATGSNAIAGQLAATNTALLGTIAAGSNAIANSLAATNTAILATITTGSNFFATSLAGTNAALVTRITNATNSINAASLTGTAPIAVLPPATVSTLGVVRADNATITNVGGVLYAVHTGDGSLTSVSGDGTLITGTITNSGAFTAVPAAGFTFLGGPQGAGPGQPSYQPYSNITNALNTELLLLNTTTSNALIATNNALLVTIAAGSNAIAGQLAGTNTALLATIAAGSNAISGQLAGTNTALLATIAASSNSSASALAATNTSLLATISAGSNSIANSLAATNTAILATITASSNAANTTLLATNTAILVTLAAQSNSITGKLAATNTALLVTIATGSNAIATALAGTNTALLATISTGSNFFATSLAGTNTALTAEIIAATNTINASSLVGGPAPVGVLPVATSGALGISRPDDSTITISGGILSATAPPANVKTLPQQIFTNAAGQLAITPGYRTTNAAVVGSVQFLPGAMAIGDDGNGNLAIFNPATNFYFGTSFGNTNGVIFAAIVNTANGVLQFTNDTAISRKTAKVVAIGSGVAGDGSGTAYASGIVVTNTTNLSTLSAAFLATDSSGKVIAPTNFSASIITNVPGTNRYYDNVGRFEVDTNLNLLGTMEINGTNAASGQVLTAINGSGGVAFRPAGGGGSQTPWTSDINAAQHKLTNATRVLIEGALGTNDLETNGMILQDSAGVEFVGNDGAGNVDLSPISNGEVDVNSSPDVFDAAGTLVAARGFFSFVNIGISAALPGSGTFLTNDIGGNLLISVPFGPLILSSNIGKSDGELDIGVLKLTNATATNAITASKYAMTNNLTNVFTVDPLNGAVFGGAITFGGVTKTAWPSDGISSLNGNVTNITLKGLSTNNSLTFPSNTFLWGSSTNWTNGLARQGTATVVLYLADGIASVASCQILVSNSTTDITTNQFAGQLAVSGVGTIIQTAFLDLQSNSVVSCLGTNTTIYSSSIRYH